jgi:N-terminal half of MaoC dehydratase
MENVRFPVEAGAIMLFARSVGDPNPVYSDEKYAAGTEPGGVIAPPTFVQSVAQFDPDWYLRPRIGEPWFGSGKEPTGMVPSPGGGSGDTQTLGSTLHAEQSYEYHRNVMAGDVLVANSIPGKSWEKEGRSGRLRFNEQVTEFRDEKTGELVVTARSVSVATEGPKA